jgi:hypothetical protein
MSSVDCFEKCNGWTTGEVDILRSVSFLIKTLKHKAFLPGLDCTLRPFLVTKKPSAAAVSDSSSSLRKKKEECGSSNPDILFPYLS